MKDQQGGQGEGNPFTAILFVHGIGRPNQHENIGKLIDMIEQATADAGQSTGIFRKFRPRRELHRIDPARIISFVAFRRFVAILRKQDPANTKWDPRARYQAYEVHWAPLGKLPASRRHMISWAFRQILKTPGIAFSAWLKQPRLHRARLHHLLRGETRPAVTEADAAALLSYYSGYQGLTARRSERRSKYWFQRGATTSLFARYVMASAPDPVTGARLGKIVERWGRNRLPVETRMRHALLRVSILIAVTALIACTAWQWLSPLRPLLHERGLLAAAQADRLHVYAAAIAIAPPLLGGWFIIRFLGTIFSDVRYFSSFLDRDQFYEIRRSIIERAKADISHVLRDPACARLVIIAHSLGTAVALDALQEIGVDQPLHKSDPLDTSKISHFFTLGSPIDKISYLFERYDSRYYRARQLGDAARGDLSSLPFYKDRPKIKWRNYWDPADPVADPLFTPYGSDVNGGRIETAAIENIEVSNSGLFDPLAAHIGYFEQPEVRASLMNAIIFNDDRKGFQPTFVRGWFLRLCGEVHRYAVSAGVLIYAALCICYLHGAMDAAWLCLEAFLADGVIMIASFSAYHLAMRTQIDSVTAEP